jgi:hypothetical protein
MSLADLLNDVAPFMLEVQVSPHMVRCKTAACMGSTLYLSPAMFDLLQNAETDGDRERLLSKIPVIRLSDFMHCLRLPIPNSP